MDWKIGGPELQPISGARERSSGDLRIREASEFRGRDNTLVWRKFRRETGIPAAQPGKRSEPTCCFPRESVPSFLWDARMRDRRKDKADVRQGTLSLMVLRTLEVLGQQHGYGIARRIEQISGDLLAVNQGTLYPVLLKLEQEGAIASEWGASENNRRARFYRLTRQGQKQLRGETEDWERTSAIIGRFLSVKAEDLL
jgi:PadR family transcriptional regulator, regulatory protein PadR